MDRAAHLDHIETDAEALIATATTSLDATIDFLSDWKVRDLVAHIGAVWATATAQVTGDGDGSNIVAPGPEAQAPEGDAIIGWINERRDALVSALGSTDPAKLTWSFAGPNTVEWWTRRLASETAVHRWDAQAAAGDPQPIDSDLAADAVDEYLHVGLQFSGRRPNRTYPTETLHLHRSDGPGEWMLTRGETENDVVITHEHGKGDAAVRGAASDLMLWVWGRPTDAIEIFGDESVAQAWQELAP